MPTATPIKVVAAVVAARVADRDNALELSARFDVSASTAGRIIRRAGLPRLADIDRITGETIRASRATDHRYERDRAGDLIHVDVKKLGRIPDVVAGAPTDAQSPCVGAVSASITSTSPSMTTLGWRSHRSRPTKATTCAAFMADAAAFFASHGIRVREVMTDNALAYRRSRAFRNALASLTAMHRLIRPRSPWQNGKAERFNRTLADGWAYRRPYASNTDRTTALDAWLEHYNYARPHTAAQGRPPISRLTPTS